MTRCLALTLALLFTSCVATGDTPAEKRANINQRTEEVLTRLYGEAPEARELIADAAGYAVFSNFGVDVLFIGGGGGYGVAVDNSSGQRTYMRMGEAGVGIGLGVKDFRVVFVFENQDRLDSFIEEGWEVGADATAAAGADGEGVDASEGGSFIDGVAVYHLTESGLALRANIKGTKYWVDGDLN